MLDFGRVRAGGSAVALLVLLPLTSYAAWAGGSEPDEPIRAVRTSASTAAGAVATSGRAGADGPVGSVTASERPVVLPDATGIDSASPAQRKKWTPSGVGRLDLPSTAQYAYQFAASTMRGADPGCDLRWTLLAAIGKIESDHGRFAGSVLGTDGVSRPVIRGVALNGVGPVAAIPDTDGGQLDGDTRWDRAVGPMQFLPSTWSAVGVDADGDGQRSPDDLHDAALAAAVYLCAYEGSIGSGRGEYEAIYRYNHSASYVASVRRLERAYRIGDFELLQAADSVTLDLPWNNLPDGETVTATRPIGPGSGAATSQPPAKETPKVTSNLSRGGPKSDPEPLRTKPTPTEPTPTEPTPTEPTPTEPTPTEPTPTEPEPTPTEPEPTPTEPTPTEPEPTPTEPTPTEPEPVAVVELEGLLAACEDSWCLDDVVLDLGKADLETTVADKDYDGDGTLEPIADELAGLAGTVITVGVDEGTRPAVVRAIRGLPYPSER